MPRYSIFKNGVTGLTFATMAALPLALYTPLAKARGVGVAHQTSMQTTTVGRATNPPQMESLIFDRRVDNCDVQNCGAVLISGQSQRNNFGDSIPYTAGIYADANECLRLEITYQVTKAPPEPADLQIVLVSPTGSIWRNDDLHGTRPVVTARTDVKGRYTVHINQSKGVQPINSIQTFGLAYGRYVIGTPVNCPEPAAATFAALME